MIECYVYRQDPPHVTKVIKGDGTAEFIGRANLHPIGSVFVKHPSQAMEEAKRKFNILHPVIEVVYHAYPI